MTTLQVHIEDILTEEEIEELPYSLSRDGNCWLDFLRAVRESSGKDAIYIGMRDNYFPDPVAMTTEEMDGYAEFWFDQQGRTMSEGHEDWQSLDEISSAVYDCAMEVDSKIVDRVWRAISQPQS